MTHPRWSLSFLAVAAAALVAVHAESPQRLYSLEGHGHDLFLLTETLLWLLMLTHAGLVWIMWAQRAHWNAADASIFRFIGITALFWTFFMLTTREQRGIPLSNIFLLALLLLTVGDLDWQLLRRHVFFRREAATDETRGDPTGTAGERRVQERIDAQDHDDASAPPS